MTDDQLTPDEADAVAKIRQEAVTIGREGRLMPAWNPIGEIRALVDGLWEERIYCRVCGSFDLASVLDLGDVVPDGMDQALPLHLKRCRNCQLVQISGTLAASQPTNVLHQTDDPGQRIRLLVDLEIDTVFDPPYVVNLLKNPSFGMVNHTDILWFSATSLKNLIERNGLWANDAGIADGVLRMDVQRERKPDSPALLAILKDEAELFASENVWIDFGVRYQLLRDEHEGKK